MDKLDFGTLVSIIIFVSTVLGGLVVYIFTSLKATTKEHGTEIKALQQFSAKQSDLDAHKIEIKKDLIKHKDDTKDEIQSVKDDYKDDIKEVKDTLNNILNLLMTERKKS